MIVFSEYSEEGGSMKNEMMKQTMYDPSFEKDACGMGFIAQRDGKASRKLIDYALMMLERMNHRGEQAPRLIQAMVRVF